ncbi:endonuclease/exonuclease/phosphatase family protein [bacterium]|nr:endonuclease/exonuclease/phosphatase family protein [bacterium]
MIRSLLICANLLSFHAAHAEPLRILTYNVLYGFNHGKAPETGAKWIAGQKPDIVALQELNGFKQSSLEQIAKKWNHDHARILKEKGFPVGLTANSEITVIEKRLDGMWHGYLHCKVKDKHLFVVHLSPSRHAFRMKEATLLCAKVKPLLAAGEPVLVLGDFNCNSPLDQKWLAARPKDEEVIDEKTAKRRAGNADPDSAVMSQFLDLGLIDLVHAKQPTAELKKGTFATRLLPKYQTDEQRKDKTWRIDFILADPTLAKRCSSARIPRDKEVDLISDHYPVETVIGN